MYDEDKNLDRVISILEQCRDTLEWQVGTGNSTVDFLYPKIKHALTLLVGATEYIDEKESTTREQLTLYTYDFVNPSSDDEE